MNVRAQDDGRAVASEAGYLFDDDLDLGTLVDAVSTLERVAAVRAQRMRGNVPLTAAETALEDFDVNAIIGLTRQ